MKKEEGRMKTLDEVIKALENCDSAIDDCAGCAYFSEDCENLRPLRDDAVFYLKQFQRIVKILGPIVRLYENIG